VPLVAGRALLSWPYRPFVNEDEARALVTALDREFSYPTSDSWVLSRRAAVESYTANPADDGSWCVTLLWRQGEHRFGFRVRHLEDAVVVGSPTPEHAALDLRMLFVEEPHAAEGDRDVFGRYWVTE
jgi:hypothetical protein